MPTFTGCSIKNLFNLNSPQVIRKLLFYILFTLAIAILLGFYYRFGGFNKIIVRKIETSTPYTVKLSGRIFTGRIQDKAWKDLFFEIHDKILKNILREPITIIYYTKPEEHKGNIDAFIGAELLGNSVLPAEFTVKELVCRGVLCVDLKMHPVIMPSPGKVKKLIGRFASENKLMLDSLLIEKYHADNSLTVEIPIR